MNESTNLRAAVDGEAAAARSTNVRVTVPHGGAGTHTLMFAVEVDDAELQFDDGLIDILCDRFRHEVERVLEARRNHDELDLFLRSCRFSLADLQAYDGRPAVAAARNELMWRLRRCGWSYPKIGRLLGRDHTTVMSGVRRHESDRKLAATRADWAVAS